MATNMMESNQIVDKMNQFCHSMMMRDSQQPSWSTTALVNSTPRSSSPDNLSVSIYHFKILIPASATGAIIGKGGSTIAQLQASTGARVRISKATQLYPGTNERVCLISGTIDAIIRIHDFIMYKIRESLAQQQSNYLYARNQFDSNAIMKDANFLNSSDCMSNFNDINSSINLRNCNENNEHQFHQRKSSESYANSSFISQHNESQINTSQQHQHNEQNRYFSNSMSSPNTQSSLDSSIVSSTSSAGVLSGSLQQPINLSPDGSCSSSDSCESSPASLLASSCFQSHLIINGHHQSANGHNHQVNSLQNEDQVHQGNSMKNDSQSHHLTHNHQNGSSGQVLNGFNRRDKQVKILVPNTTAGMIIGKGGQYIMQMKRESGAYIQISQKSFDVALPERCITVMGNLESNKKACEMILSKIVEDPGAGAHLNINYSDVNGPVANFDPTGSPYAKSTYKPDSYDNNGHDSSLYANVKKTSVELLSVNNNLMARSLPISGCSLVEQLTNKFSSVKINDNSSDFRNHTIEFHAEKNDEELSDVCAVDDYDDGSFQNGKKWLANNSRSLSSNSRESTSSITSGLGLSIPRSQFPTDLTSLDNINNSGTSSSLMHADQIDYSSNCFSSQITNNSQDRNIYERRGDDLILNENRSGVGQIYSLRILIPASATGAIIGKGGSTIAQLQASTGAHVRISKATQLYSSTTERVCLISGAIDAIVKIHDFIMYKIRESLAQHQRQNNSTQEQQNDIKTDNSSNDYADTDKLSSQQKESSMEQKNRSSSSVDHHQNESTQSADDNDIASSSAVNYINHDINNNNPNEIDKNSAMDINQQQQKFSYTQNNACANVVDDNIHLLNVKVNNTANNSEFNVNVDVEQKQHA